MTPETKHLEVVLDTHVESVNLAEEMCLRVAEAVGFSEDECYRIGMSVREGVINAFHYGNQEKPAKKMRGKDSNWRMCRTPWRKRIC
jgi:anti-sigma regulatory factor (Ser/Thr protein kinase)